MTRIDRYILFLFLRVFGICFCSLTGLLIVVHLFTNLDDLIDVGKASGNLLGILVTYYGPYSLSLFTRLCPLFSLMAMLFCITWLKRTHELTALMAAGIPKGRALRMPIIATVALIASSTVVREFVIPAHQDILGKTPQDLSGQNFRSLRPALDPTSGILIGGHHIELLKEQIIRPIFRLAGPAAKVGRQISAALATYERADVDHPAGYKLVSVSSPATLPTEPSIFVEGKPLILTAVDNPWLQPGECFVVSSVQFFLLQGGSGWGQYDSTMNIIKRVHAQPSFYGTDVHVNIHTRFLQPFLDLTMVFFGVPIVLRRVDRHLFFIASAVMWSIMIFTAVVMGAQVVASNNPIIAPFLGAWLPLLLVGPFAWAKVRLAMQS